MVISRVRVRTCDQEQSNAILVEFEHVFMAE